MQAVLATAHLQLDTLYLGLEDAAATKMYRCAQPCIWHQCKSECLEHREYIPLPSDTGQEVSRSSRDFPVAQGNAETRSGGAARGGFAGRHFAECADGDSGAASAGSAARLS